MKRIIVTVMVIALLMTSATAWAMPIQVEGGALHLPAASIVDGAVIELGLSEFQLLAFNDDDSFLIHDGRQYFNVDASDLRGVLAALAPEQLAALGTVGTLETLERGARGEEVRRFQEALRTLGYLQGSADGDFGNGTENAINAFQEALGVEPTGAADELLQLLALSMAAEPVPVDVSSADPTAVYAPIASRVKVNMQPIYDSGLSFEYDDMTGKGFITDGTVVECDASGDADIDRYQLSLRFGLLVRDNVDEVTVVPAAEIRCLCVRRPVIGELILKSGSFRGSADIEELETALDGVNTVEKGFAVLTDDMIEALADAAVNGELKLRIGGRYNTFDVQVAPEFLPSLARVGEVARRIKR